MSVLICKFFRSEQGCKFGNKCRYKHSESPPPTLLSDYQNQYEGSVKKSFYSPGTSSLPQEHTILQASTENEVSVRSQQVGLYSSKNPSEPCSTPNNECPVSCAFSLDISCAQLQQQFEGLEAASQDEQAVASSFNPNSQQRPARKLCHYYSRNGSCYFGSRCRFEHSCSYTSYRTPPRFQWAQDDPRALEALAEERQVDKPEEGQRVRYPRGNNGKNFSSYPADKSIQLKHAGSALTARDEVAEDQSADLVQAQEATEHCFTLRKQQVSTDKVCQFYLTGRCWRGKRCKFLHPGRQSAFGGNRSATITIGQYHENSKEDQGERGDSIHKQVHKPTESSSTGKSCHKEVAFKPSSTRQTRPSYVAQGTKKYGREEVDDVEGSRLRRTEIDQLVKRFPRSKVKVNRDCAEYFQCIVSFSPTDPDWPFDVKLFQLQVDIPADYPLKMLTISLPVEQDLPETVRRYLEVSIEEWLEDRERQLEDQGQVELVFRPFLRWLDRNIEDVVTEGLRQLKRELVAKAAGLEFISAKQLQKQYPGQTLDHSDDADNEEDEETTSGSQEEDTSSTYEDSEEEESGGERNEELEDENSRRKSRQDKVKALLAEPDRRGTEVGMKNLQLKESTATLYFEKICLSIQCERCKGTSEFIASGGRVNVVQCGQCSQTQMATFRPAMMHQFSAVAGYLDLDGCLPFDVNLQNCSAVISCLHCSKETKPGAVLPGQPQDHWCRVCHRKLRVSTDGVRFTQLEHSRNIQSLKGVVKVVVPTRKRIPKDPAIQEGKPLPNFGTCKHYKKSYRWLRFPCCGKCYPCDICHDSKEDHEMKYANRMICGFCCKEQAYAAERPCKGCDMNMIKIHTQHWEGGHGCRDKISMSRNDKQKHRNMTKTVSKHAQKVRDMQSKKKTKLRHT